MDPVALFISLMAVGEFAIMSETFARNPNSIEGGVQALMGLALAFFAAHRQRRSQISTSKEKQDE